MHAHESRRHGLPKPRNSEKRTPPALGRRHLLPAAARPRLRVRKRIRPMSKTAAARYTQGPTMTTDSLAVKPARPRDPDRQAPPTTVRSAQPHAVLRPRPGVTGPQLTESGPGQPTRACHPSDREVETRRPAFPSAAKSIGCTSRGLGFGSQHPHGGAQPSVISVTEDPMPSSDQARTLYTDIHACKHSYT